MDSKFQYMYSVSEKVRSTSPTYNFLSARISYLAQSRHRQFHNQHRKHHDNGRTAHRRLPHDRSRSRRSINFADTAEINIVDRHENNDGVDRQDLWYNESDYTSMRLATKRFILKVRALVSDGAPISYSGDDGSSEDCLVGAEHLLSKKTIREVKTSRRRCVQAVLQEQARQSLNPTDNLNNWDDRWTDIALASLVETRSAAVRARKLGKIHHDFS